MCTNLFSQQRESRVEIFFNLGESVINSELEGNSEKLNQLVETMRRLQSDPQVTIDRVVVTSSASPEAEMSYNLKLTEERSKAILEFLKDKGIEIPSSKLEVNSLGIAWDKLREMVSNSGMEYRDEVIYILENVPEERWKRVNPDDQWATLVDSRNKHLMDLKGGEPYKYMRENMFPLLRSSNVVTLYYERKPDPKPDPKPQQVKKEVAEPVVEPVGEVKPIEYKPLFALKTNLLYDALSLINAELEVPIGNHWSIAGEWIFPWWSWDNGAADSKRHRIQLLNGNLEAKYWFGDRDSRHVMTGWFAGLYAGVGKYDFEYDREGYQGDFYIATGISGGYAHTINKKGNLRMEYSLGVGYIQSDYKHYKSHYGVDDTWHPMIEESGTFKWIGPTKAKVSLVWLINRKIK